MTIDAENTAGRRGPYRNGIKRRQEIIEAAQKVFAQHGYIGGSLRQIAQEVGVSPAALVRHFETKEDLLAEVIEQTEDGMIVDLFGDARGMDYFDNSIRLIEENLKNRGMVELLLTLATEASHPDHPAREHLQKRYRRILESTEKCLREAREAGEVVAMDDATLALEARAYVGLMDGLEIQWLLDPTMDLHTAWAYHYGLMRERWTTPRG